MIRQITTWGIVGLIILLSIINAFAQGDKLTPRQQLEKDLVAVPFGTSEYKVDIFDCSNMAALIVKELDAKGYDAEIVVVHSKIDKNCYHTFVVVDREVVIEPTFKLITFSEGKYEEFGSLDWYIETWGIIGVYTDSEEAIKKSKWGFTEWNTGILRK